MEELEITFLPKSLPAGVLKSTFKEIKDIYIPKSSPHPKLRIRKNGESYQITKKLPITEGDASHQSENTIPLTIEEYNALDSVSGNRIRKLRYEYHEDGYKYEIDVFQDKLEGLVLVDVEFDSLSAKNDFILPNWCLKDVTQELFVAGGMLCNKSYDDIKDRLEEFNYSKLST